ncbi:hypothetical protein BHE74_00010190, partial [Ensete ventricosum]
MGPKKGYPHGLVRRGTSRSNRSSTSGGRCRIRRRNAMRKAVNSMQTPAGYPSHAEAASCGGDAATAGAIGRSEGQREKRAVVDLLSFDSENELIADGVGK